MKTNEKEKLERKIELLEHRLELERIYRDKERAQHEKRIAELELELFNAKNKKKHWFYFRKLQP